jgi:hypothetical protein
MGTLYEEKLFIATFGKNVGIGKIPKDGSMCVSYRHQGILASVADPGSFITDPTKFSSRARIYIT